MSGHVQHVQWETLTPHRHPSNMMKTNCPHGGPGPGNGLLPNGSRMAVEPHFVYAKIFDRVGPLDRGDKYEDPLQEMLDAENLGEITGGGTMQEKTGEILFVGIDIELTDFERGIPLVARKLQELGAPPGSTLEYQVDGKNVSHLIGAPAVG